MRVFQRTILLMFAFCSVRVFSQEPAFFLTREIAISSQSDFVFKNDQDQIPVQADYVATSDFKKVALVATTLRKSTVIQKFDPTAFQVEWREKIYSISLLGFSEGDALSLISHLRTTYPELQIRGFNKRFPAQEAVVPQVSVGSKNFESVSSGLEPMLVQLKESAYKCYFQGVPEGLKNVLLDPFLDAGDSLYLAVTDFDTWVKNTQKDFRQISEAFHDFWRKMGIKKDQFLALPETEKSKLYCQLASSMGGTASAGRGVQKILQARYPVPASRSVKAEVSSVSIRESQERLQKVLAESPHQHGHQFVFEKGKAVLKIGILRNEDLTVNREILRALRAGGIQVIETKTLIHPKSLSLLRSLLRASQGSGSKFQIRGNIEPQKLWSSLDNLSPSEREAFLQSWKDFGGPAACLKIHLTTSPRTCGVMVFEMQSNNLKTSWSRAQ